jgi:hypothetical protein
MTSLKARKAISPASNAIHIKSIIGRPHRPVGLNASRTELMKMTRAAARARHARTREAVYEVDILTQTEEERDLRQPGE